MTVPTHCGSAATHCGSTHTHCDLTHTHCGPALTHCGSASELWITYHQASRAQRSVTAQLIDVGDGTSLVDLEDVLDHVFQQGFVDPKWRPVSWWEECTSARLKACHAVQDLLTRGIGNTPASALRLVIGMCRYFFLPGGGHLTEDMQRTPLPPFGFTMNTRTAGSTAPPRRSGSVLMCHI